ncbi:MAG: 3'-5' exonuclease, partial [Syntrophaceae bacterium]|nr:3'-5' exonuclease [Syntrophaceae bacterium]
VIPSTRPITPTKKGDMEEERRVVFVGISRAMKLLYLSYSHTFMGQSCRRSLFLDEIMDREPER